MYWTIASTSNEALTFGTRTAASTDAFRTKSFTVIFAESDPSPADFNSARALINGSALISMLR